MENPKFLYKIIHYRRGYFPEGFWEKAAYFPKDFWEKFDYFPEDFWEIVAYFLEEVRGVRMKGDLA